MEQKWQKLEGRKLPWKKWNEYNLYLLFKNCTFCILGQCKRSTPQEHVTLFNRSVSLVFGNVWELFYWASFGTYRRDKMLTGVITVEYLVQITPVAVTAICWGYDNNCGGLSKSEIFASVMPHYSRQWYCTSRLWGPFFTNKFSNIVGLINLSSK